MDKNPKKNTFNTSAKKPKASPQKQRNYSNEEVVKKTDHMASVAKTAEQKKEMLDIKDRYFQRSLKKQANRGERRHNLEMGIRAGIHPRGVIEREDAQNKIADQQDRNRTVKEAKNYYHRNYSLSKEFKDPKPRRKVKTKNKGMDKG